MIALLLTVLASLLVACGDRIAVGAKNFTEQRILGELLAQTVEAAGLRADRKLDLGGTFVCDAALRAGQIDMYIEYSGTALTAILKQSPGGDRAAVLPRVRAAYESAGLVWTAPLGLDNTFALVIRSEDAEQLGIHSISESVPHAARWRAGFGYEFRQRPDGYPGLVRHYGLSFMTTKLMDLGLLYRALVDHQVDIVAGNATDGLIDDLKLTVLGDDRHYFPPYEAAPIVRRQTLERYPKLGEALDRLGGKIPSEEMRRLNQAVDSQHRDLSAVVREFRTRAGL